MIDCYACLDKICSRDEKCGRNVPAIDIPEHNLDIPEAKLQEITLAHVNKIPGVEVWRMNTGGAYDASGRYVQYGETGQADLAGCIAPMGRRLEIELKAKRGRMRKAQIEYRERLVRLGALYVVARSLRDSMVPICEFLGLPYRIVPRPVKP